MKIGILAITKGGHELATELAAQLPEATVLTMNGTFAATLAVAWPQYDAFICVMAAGIVVRGLAPLLHDKKSDPCVVVLDEQGHFAISLLAGHLGGGNELARRLARLTHGQAVITTASDVLGHTALDLWARDHGLVVADKAAFTTAMARLVNQGRLKVFSEVELPQWPADFMMTDTPAEAELIIAIHQEVAGRRPQLHPCCLVAGIGCNRETPAAAIQQAFDELCSKHNLAPAAFRNLASIDLKNDEKGLLEFAGQNRYPIDFYPKEHLNSVPNLIASAAVFKATGAQGVAEPAAILSSRGQLIIGKQKWQDVTLAVAQAAWPWSAPDRAA
ncbi:MAG: cobalamin biosynthesis protein [Desulfurivibrionaceae bacterium]|nr:cobalamin biosynthesis protein [Desulfurivibrionaceae bacterium]